MVFRIKFRFSAGGCFLAAAALLVLPLRWIMGAVLAALFHELCHFLALKSCGIRIFGITVGSCGALMETAPMDRRQEFLCALAGPLGSFALVLLYRQLPVTALCAAFQGIYNLLPLGTLDGGRMIRCLFGIHVQKLVENCLITLLILFGFYGFIFLKLRFGVLIAVILMIHRAMGRKFPCKEGPLGVQ